MNRFDLTTEELKELFEARSAWEDLTEKERYIICEALLDLMTAWSRKNKK
jgi:hypothetical protein